MTSRLALITRRFLRLSRRRDVHERQDRKNVRLDESGQQTECIHQDGEKQRRYGQQDRSDFGSAHHVSKQANGQCQRTRQLANHIEGQHEWRRFDINLQILEKTQPAYAEGGHRD